MITQLNLIEVVQLTDALSEKLGVDKNMAMGMPMMGGGMPMAQQAPAGDAAPAQEEKPGKKRVSLIS